MKTFLRITVAILASIALVWIAVAPAVSDTYYVARPGRSGGWVAPSQERVVYFETLARLIGRTVNRYSAILAIILVAGLWFYVIERHGH